MPFREAKRSAEYLIPKPSLVAMINIFPAWILPSADASIATSLGIGSALSEVTDLVR